MTPDSAFWVALTALIGVIAAWLRAEYTNWRIKKNLAQYLCKTAPACANRVPMDSTTLQ